MSFEYAERTRTYVDASRATRMDRISISLEGDETVVLMLNVSGPYGCELFVDRERTDESVIDSLAAHAYERLRDWYSWDGPLKYFFAWRHRRTMPSLEEIREQMRLRVSVRSDSDSFDESPRIGERLRIMPTIDKYGGSGWVSTNLITEVTFFTI